MNAIARMRLISTPRPADADDTCVTGNPDGTWNVCWWRQGRIPEPFGDPFLSAKAACAASALVRAAVLS